MLLAQPDMEGTAPGPVAELVSALEPAGLKTELRV